MTGVNWSTPIVSHLSAIDNPGGSLPNDDVAAPTYSNAPYNGNPNALWFANTQSGEPNGYCAYHFYTIIAYGQGPFRR